MLMIYEETYPIVAIKFEQVMTLADTKTYLSRFEYWLAQKHKFGVIVHQSYSQEPSQPNAKEIEAVHRFTMQWAKQNKSKIIEFCVGLALVIDLPEIPPERQRSSSKTITAIFGCPGHAFTTCADARQWIQGKL